MNYKKLIEQLRYESGPVACDEAANAIESLLVENERLKHNLSTTEQTADALTNARLIAAAPDLLAALENVMANPTTFSFEPIRAAIASVKGGAA